MTNNQKIQMYAEIQKHGENLNLIFNTGIDSVKLCKSLRRLEKKLNTIALNYCNDEGGINSENINSFSTPIMNKVYKLLNNGNYNEDRPHQKKVPIFFNSDPRGYALKINDSYVKCLFTQGKRIYTDMGGYGIICPDFTPNN